MRVLIVEDEPEMAEQLRRGLEREGYSALIADDGQKALDSSMAARSRVGCAAPGSARRF
jgi:DNA-binding response OmpR family regulator